MASTSRPRLARIRMYWEGPQRLSARTSVRSRCIATARRACSDTARSCGRATCISFWETLKTHVPVAINTGLSGIPYWGTDIGGFVPTADYTGELHVRWFQFGTFCPSFRVARPQLASAPAVGLEHGEDPSV